MRRADGDHGKHPGLRRLLCGGLVLLTLTASQNLAAHEAGSTRVGATFTHDNHYAFELTTDAAVLLARLELARKRPRTPATTADDLQRGFDGVCGDVLEHLRISFDEQVATPEASCLVDRPLASSADGLAVLGVTVTLRGTLPVNARAFRWRYDFTFSKYALTVNGPGGSTPSQVWLDAGEDSDQLSVQRLAPPPTALQRGLRMARFGVTCILPYGPAHVLFIALLLVGRERASRRLKVLSCVAAQVGVLLLAPAVDVVVHRGVLGSLVVLSLVGAALLALWPGVFRKLSPAIVVLLAVPHALQLQMQILDARPPLGSGAELAGVCAGVAVGYAMTAALLAFVLAPLANARQDARHVHQPFVAC